MDEKTREALERLRARIEKLEIFKATTIEQLKTLFKSVEAINNRNKWKVQSITYLLAGAVISSIFTLINWMVQKLF